MLQHEFEELTGLKVSEAEYENIEMVYMADPNVDKREFCANWKHCPEPVQDSMIAIVKQHNNELARMRQEMNEALQQNQKLLELIFKRAQSNGDMELRNECIAQMGIKAYLTKMLEDGCSLWSIDKDALVELINK